MADRLILATTAVRPKLPARMMLAGPAGAGKTRSALMIAEVLAEGGRVLVIDTERESALTYADDFAFEHLPWTPPFDPIELGSTIRRAGDIYAVTIVDSASHFWRGDGGVLDIADGKFGGWKTARPAHQDFVDGVLASPGHVIVCTRSRMKHEQVLVDGRHKVNKLGLEPVQDGDLEYEMNVAVSLDIDHIATVTKSRTVALPVGRDFKPGHVSDLATIYRDWLAGGEPPAPRSVVEWFVARMNAFGDVERGAVKQEFLASLGRPDHLREAQIDDAEALVSSWEARAAEAAPVRQDADEDASEPEPVA